MFKLISILVVTVLLMDTSYAGTTKLIYHSVSKHFSTQKTLNEDNYSVGVEQWIGRNVYTLATYKDSFSTQATYIAKTKILNKSRYHALGYTLGLIHSPSYSKLSGLTYTPMLLPYLEIKATRYLQVNLMYKPKLNDKDAHVIGLQFKIKVI